MKSRCLLRNASLSEKGNVLERADAPPIAALLLSHLCRLLHRHSHKVALLHSQRWLSDSRVMKSGPLLRKASLSENGYVIVRTDAPPVAAMLLSHLCRLLHHHSHRVASLHSQPWPSDSHVMKWRCPLRVARLSEKGNVLERADAPPIAAVLLPHLC